MESNHLQGRLRSDSVGHRPLCGVLVSGGSTVVTCSPANTGGRSRNTDLKGLTKQQESECFGTTQRGLGFDYNLVQDKKLQFSSGFNSAG